MSPQNRIVLEYICCITGYNLTSWFFPHSLNSVSHTTVNKSSSVITRFVEPIDRTSYKQWSSVSPLVTPVDCGAEQLDQRTLPDSEIITNQTAGASAETEVKQLSFAEVMQLVQEGKEVPGTKKLDVKPTNQSPTPSQMERRLKPWEISAVSKWPLNF